MRLLRLDFARGHSTLDLHPFVTVVRSLDAVQRDELLETVRSLARGSTAGIRGLVQNQGLLVELDGFGHDRLLSITGANVVVDCDAFDVCGLPSLTAQIDQLRRRAEIDAVVVEEIRADLEPSARARVAELELKLDPDDAERVAQRKAEERRVSEARAALAALDPVVQEAPPEVLALRDRWDSHAARLQAAEAHFASLMRAVEQAEAGARAAREAVVVAEREARPVLLTREEEARLEELSFPDQDDSRRGRWRRQDTSEAELEAERTALLEKVGVDSWTAYTVYRAAPAPRSERVEAAAVARQELEAAEARLAETRAILVNDELTTQLNDELDSIRADSRPFLGQLLPSNLGQALHELVVEKPNPDWVDAARHLAAALAELGAAGADGGPPDPTELVALADGWLEERRRDAVAVDREALSQELASARQVLERHDRALARIVRAERAASSSARHLAELEQQLAAAGDGGPRTTEAILALVGPVVAQVEHEAHGSVPVAVVGGFGELDDGRVVEMMDELGAQAARVQILVITEHPAAAAWAEGAGLERALAVRPRPAAEEAAPTDS